VPLPLGRVDVVEALVLILGVADVVENEELGFRAEVGDVADAGGLQVGFGFAGDVARVAGVVFLGDRIDDVADQRQRRLGVNGSITAVAGSGMTSMSLAWIGCQPRIDEPSKPRPSSNTLSSISLGGTVKCCQMPRKSLNFKSIATAFCSFMNL